MKMRKFNITVNGTSYEVTVEETTDSATQSASPATAVPAPAAAQSPAPAAAVQTKAKSAPVSNISGTAVKAPMQGVLLKFSANVGQKVKKGDLLCILEAMKLENEIFSPVDGTVSAVSVEAGATVASGDTIMVIA